MVPAPKASAIAKATPVNVLSFIFRSLIISADSLQLCHFPEARRTPGVVAELVGRIIAYAVGLVDSS